MTKYSFYEQAILDQAFFLLDEGFSKALSSFFSKAKGSNLSLGHEKKSIFFLVERCLDKHFKRVFLVDCYSSAHAVGEDFAILPSSMKDLPPGYSFGEDQFYSTKYQNSVFILGCWRSYLRALEKKMEYLQAPIIFRILEYLIIYLKEFTPKEVNLQLNNENSQTRPTRSSNKKIHQHCELCCRETLLFEKYIEQRKLGNALNVNDWGLSSKFCEDHKPRDGQNWVYLKSHRRKKEMIKESLSILNPGSSAFLPNFEWFSKYIKDLNNLEIRGIAIKLVHSKLNSNKKKKIRYDILKYLSQGISKNEISIKIGLSVRSINRQIERIISEITEILRYPFLDSQGKPLKLDVFDSSPFRGQPLNGHLLTRRRQEIWNFNQEYKVHKNLNSFLHVKGQRIVKICYSFPVEPDLETILEATRESLKSIYHDHN